MPIGPGTASVIGSLLDLGGGLFGQSSASKSRARDRAQAQQQFNAQMDESVQRRVADAQKAGIHPLFALGGSVGASPTTVSGGSSDAGTSMQNALSRIGDRIQQQAMSRTKLDEAQASYYDALAAKARNEVASQGRDIINTPNSPDMPTAFTNQGDPMGAATPYSPEVPFSSKDGVQAGTYPLWREIRTQSGEVVKVINDTVPGGEEINQILLPVLGWWSTTKSAARRLTDRLRRLGMNYSYNKQGRLVIHSRGPIRKEIHKLNKALSGPPIR